MKIRSYEVALNANEVVKRRSYEVAKLRSDFVTL